MCTFKIFFNHGEANRGKTLCSGAFKKVRLEIVLQPGLSKGMLLILEHLGRCFFKEKVPNCH